MLSLTASRCLRKAPLLRPSSLRRALSTSIDASSMLGRDLDTMFSFTGDEQRTLLRLAAALKARLRDPHAKPYQPLVRDLAPPPPPRPPSRAPCASRRASQCRPYLSTGGTAPTLTPLVPPPAGGQDAVHDFSEAQHAHARVRGGGLCAAGRPRHLPGCVSGGPARAAPRSPPPPATPPASTLPLPPPPCGRLRGHPAGEERDAA